MLLADSLPAALAAHAAACPEEPWFFVRAGWDWDWAPWREVEERVKGWAKRLADLPPGSRLGFPDRPWPRAIVLDLAAQAAGLASVPLREGGTGLERLAAGRGCRAWVGPDDRIVDAGLGEGDGAGEHHGEMRETREAGGAVVTGPGGLEELSQEDLRRAAGEMQRLVSRGGEREILVTGGSLEDPAERRLMAWTLRAGAAVVLEDDPVSAAATAAWARPTVFFGGAEALATLRRGVESTSGWSWRRRLPFGRLHTALVEGRAELSEAERAFWIGRGVRLAQEA
jgi:hypothetical protein